MKKILFLAKFSALVFIIGACSQKVDTTISVDASKVENVITPYLYGSCIEDVNHEIYGGLYDQKIFGESFEEPIPTATFEHFTVYDGEWQAENNNIAVVKSCPGGKLVYSGIEMSEGTIETEIKFDNTNGDNAGLLVQVTQPGKGADKFSGYEVSLKANGTKVVFGKHQQNWQPIKEVEARYSPLEWNCLTVKIANNALEVFLNGKSLFIYEDKKSPLDAGKMALRTWNSDVKFRNVTIKTNERTDTLQFKTIEAPHVSAQWQAMQSPEAKAVFTHDNKDAFNGQYSQVIKFVEGSGTVGINNMGLNRWGIAVKQGQTYQGSLYIKATALKSAIKVALQSADGSKEYAMQEVLPPPSIWGKCNFTLTSNATDPQARFAIYIDQPGELRIDQVMLMGTGNEQFKGLSLRNDIGTAMVKQGLTFLRYGGTMINAPEYRFKKMIGSPDRRPPYRGHWYPYSTNGFGIEDFLQFCEAAGFEASFAVNIEETPQDMADMVEYLNGPITSAWGKKRAENGHPEPYGVKYIGIGNEEVIHADDAEGYKHYIERFNLLYDAMKGKDSSVILINTAWWRPESANMEMVFKALNGKAAYWDYHPWADGLNSGKNVEKELRQMQTLFHTWDSGTQMKCAIFEENGNTHNLQRTLGHVTLQNAVRRMGNFVLTSCAANALQPYLQNDNGWDQGQVFFTPSQVWGMPPYYAQQMASNNHQPLRVYSESGEMLDVTATRSENGNQLVLHIANINNEAISANITIAGFEKVAKAKIICLSGNLEDVNTPEQPEKIIPVENELKPTTNLLHTFPAHSYTILVFLK